MLGLFTNLQFALPVALWGLLALPVIWWLLRFVPPRPERVAFPPLRLLLKLKDTKETPSKTPWWLLLLRLALAAALIFGVAGPFMGETPPAQKQSGPLLLIVDNGFAAAPDWPQRLEALTSLVKDAAREDRSVALVGTTPQRLASTLAATSADTLLKTLPTLKPQALGTDREALLTTLKAAPKDFTSAIWLSDGHNQKSGKAFAAGLSNLFGGNISVITLDKPTNLMALANPKLKGSDITLDVLRQAETPLNASLEAKAADGHVLTQSDVTFTSDQVTTSATITLPIELRNEIQTITLKDQNQAAATLLLDDRWRRKTLAIETNLANADDQALLAPTHYLTSALEPYAALLTPSSGEELKAVTEAGLSMLVLADVGKLPKDDHDAIAAWVEKGGLLLRFAGPRLAAGGDDLLPVQLREGDRSFGSALSWETPQALAPFAAESPFSGIVIDPQITVQRQLLAEPDAELSSKTWVSLADGTPLVTAAKRGKGLIVLFHITANADWSNLPLTGTFPDMLKKLVEMAPAAGSTDAASATTSAQGRFALRLALAGTGDFASPPADLPSFASNDLEAAKASASKPAGLYQRDGENRAINLVANADDVSLLSDYAPLQAQNLKPNTVKDFTPLLFILAALLFMADCLAAVFLGGLWRRQNILAAALAFAMIMPMAPDHARADVNITTAMQAALLTRLAYVKTGNSEVDTASEQGLKGLTFIMTERTSANIGTPIGVDIEADDISYFPLLYWPVLPDAKQPSAATASKLSSFMKNGGTILFDLRDGGGFGGSAASEALKLIVTDLDIPPLEPVPEGHALTKSFYILKDFPGRYEGTPMWVESQSDTAASNADNVSGIIISSNDLAAAWAIDDKDNPVYAMVGGSDRQREMAYRVGVNIVMYTLTGNYKTDQVHVPALLERLGKE
jgi:hypothetical protein